MDVPTETIPTSKTPNVLTIPLTRKEAIIALYAAVAKARKGRTDDSPWTEVTLRDGALD